jgi:hypothetical protein
MAHSTHHQQTRVKIICLLVSSAWLMLLCSCATQESVRTSRPSEVAINAEAVRGGSLHLTLRLEDGEELVFMVDTGMPQTVLDKSLEPKLGKCLGRTTFRYASYGKSKTRVYAAPRLYLGKLQLQLGRRVLTDNLTIP